MVRQVGGTEGLRNTRRSMGDGTFAGRTRIATPFRADRRQRPAATIIPHGIRAGAGATITLSALPDQEFAHNGGDGDVLLHDDIVEAITDFPAVTLPAAAPSLPFDGVWSMVAEIVFDAPVPEGTTVELVDAQGEIIYRDGSPWVAGYDLVLGPVQATFGAWGQRWNRGLSPSLRIVPPVGETVTVAHGRAVWKAEGARSAVASPGPDPFEPEDLLLHLDASGFTEAGNLPLWNDDSGSGNHVIEGSTSRQPEVVLGVLNGQPVVRFDGDSNGSTSQGDRLRRTSMARTSDQPVTIFAVVRNTATEHDAIRELILCLSGNNRRCEIAVKGDGNLRIISGLDSSPEVVWGPIDTAWHVIEAVFDGASSLVAVDGGTPATGTVDNQPFDGTLTIGTAFVDGWHGDVAEIKVHPGALDSTERAAARASLASKWGL